MSERLKIYLNNYPANFDEADIINVLYEFNKGRSNFFTKSDILDFVSAELYTNYYDELDNLLKDFSKKHKGIFETTSYCVETDEYFRDYYKDGKCQTEIGRLEFDKFDESKLK